MNALLLNRDGFQMPADGWYQVAPLGEFAHAQAGLVQVVDPEACTAMVNRFADEATGVNFAGLLVDFDHFSLDGEKRSEAAGWITGLEYRGREAEGCRLKADSGDNSQVANGGLFAKIRWSDVGEVAVKGGRYRFLSPVWARSDCVDLGNGRVRPVRLLNAAVTNDPNLKGMQPLSNRHQASGDSRQGGESETSTAKDARDAKKGMVNAGGSAAGAAAATGPVKAGEPRFKWVLGETMDGRHCPSCTAVAGQVHTMAEWDAAGVRPGGDGLFCQGNCKCRLAPTNEVAVGVLVNVPLRNRADTEGAERQRTQSGRVSTAKDARGREGGGGEILATDCADSRGLGNGKMLANVGWTNEARVASLEVRRAKALRRGQGGTAARDARLKERQQASMEKASKDYAAIFEAKGLDGMSAEEVEYMTARVGKRVQNGSALTDTEKRFMREMKARGADGDLGGKEKTVVKNSQANETAKGGERGTASVAAADACAEIRKDVRTRRDKADCETKSGADDAPCITMLVNTGWKEQARVAALAVRRAKAGKRGAQAQVMPARPAPDPTDTGIYLGGSKYFDEASGQYRYPDPGAVAPPKQPGQPKKGQPVSFTPPYRFLSAGARRARAGAR
jgi:hypothetical protein